MRRTWAAYESLKQRPSWVAPEELSSWRFGALCGGYLHGETAWAQWCFGLGCLSRVIGPEAIADFERVITRALPAAELSYAVPADLNEEAAQLLWDAATFLKSPQAKTPVLVRARAGHLALRAAALARQEAFWRGKRSVPYAAGRRAQRKGGLREKHRESERLVRMTSCLFDCPGPIRTSSRPDRTPDLLSLLAAIDASHDLTALPALGDALEEAGLVYDELLAHLRGPGPHCWGCWALEYAFSLAGR